MGRHQKAVGMATVALAVVACLLSVGIGKAGASVSCSDDSVSDVSGWGSYVINIVTMLARETPSQPLRSPYTTNYAGQVEGTATCKVSDIQSCIDCMNRLQGHLQSGTCLTSSTGSATDSSTSCTMSFHKL
ncbi:unnamed protein product [Linum trigynum]|uniref:Gnk2-homologous domain-containing protein n=1 Tax=Linum trigynum TaxID=586398 RepID=A0AAV2ER35_9ROSI